jgi:hypothetical protein
VRPWILLLGIAACKPPPASTVARRELVDGWSMEFDTRYRRQDDGGSLYFVRPTKPLNYSIEVAVQDIGSKSPKEAIEAILKGEAEEHHEGGVIGRARRTKRDHLWEVHGCSVAAPSLIELRFKVPETEVDAAMAAWRSLRR